MIAGEVSMPATMAEARPVGTSRTPESVAMYRPRPGRSGSQMFRPAEKQTSVMPRPARPTARQGRTGWTRRRNRS